MPTSNTGSNSKSKLPRIILTTGEPAGIGPDLAIAIAGYSFEAQLVFLTDPEILMQRAGILSLPLEVDEYDADAAPARSKPGRLTVKPARAAAAVNPGHPDPRNSDHVLNAISSATHACINGEFDAMVTAPVNKAVINESGHDFSGHTEFIAQLCGIERPVMVLMNAYARVALVTTHLPLSLVPQAITTDRLEKTLGIINSELQHKLAIANPRILVCGLNPHAGEQGYLGTEETDIIEPVINRLKSRGMDITGPVPADTAFTPELLEGCDIVVAMYHDQGLPVLKSHGFGTTVNTTLGLPIIRTSVDHGTALSLAGTGKASSTSMRAAVESAIDMVLRSGG